VVILAPGPILAPLLWGRDCGAVKSGGPGGHRLVLESGEVKMVKLVETITSPESQTEGAAHTKKGVGEKAGKEKKKGRSGG